MQVVWQTKRSPKTKTVLFYAFFSFWKRKSQEKLARNHRFYSGPYSLSTNSCLIFFNISKHHIEFRLYNSTGIWTMNIFKLNLSCFEHIKIQSSVVFYRACYVQYFTSNYTKKVTYLLITTYFYFINWHKS